MTGINGFLGYKRASWLRGLIIVLFVLMSVDTVITYVGISWYGIGEKNPLFAVMGLWGFMAFKMCVTFAIVPLWLWLGRQQYLMTVTVVSFLIGLYTVVTYNNIW